MKPWQQILNDHYDDPYHRGACDVPTHAASARCPASGCVIAYELCVDPAGRVVQAWFEGEGCPTCEAVASLLAAYAEKRTQAELQSLTTENLSACLNLGDSAEWQQAVCALLPWTAVCQAFKQPLDPLDGDLADGTNFGGPSLREEC